MGKKYRTKEEIVKEQLERLAILKEHYEPLWPEIKIKVNEITDPLKKIEFLQDALHDYMEKIISTPELLNCSGDYIDNSKPKKIGMDALIENEIIRIRKKYGLKDSINNSTALNQQKPNKFFKLELDIKEYYKDVLDKLQPTFIGNNVSLIKFKKIFSGKTISENDKAEWLGTPASLHYFIDEIDKNQKQSTKWITACNCFYINGFSNTPKDLANNKEVSKKDKDKLIIVIKQFHFLPLQ